MTLADVLKKEMFEIMGQIEPVSQAAENQADVKRYKNKRQQALTKLLESNIGSSSVSIPLDAYVNTFFSLRDITPMITNEQRLENVYKFMEQDMAKRVQGMKDRAGWLSRSWSGTLAIAYGIIAGKLLYKYGFDVAPLSYSVAAAALAVDAVSPRDTRISPALRTAILVSCFPVIDDVVSAYVLESQELYKGAAVKALLGPGMIIARTQSGFNFAAFEEAKLNIKKINAYAVKGLSREVKERMRRLSFVMDEINKVQGIDDLNDKEHSEDITSFDQECINYIANDSTKADVTAQREALERVVKKPLRLLVPEKLDDDHERDKEKDKKDFADLYHFETYQLLTHIGMDETISRRVARSLTHNEAKETINMLIGASLQDEYKDILGVNPDLFYLKGRAKSEYNERLHQILGRIRTENDGEIPNELSPALRPLSYSSIHGLRALERELDGVAEELTDYSRLGNEGYKNHILLNAILTRGFRLGGQARPRIGMQYAFIGNIRNNTSTDPFVTSKDMKEFNKMFGRLIRDGVVLDNKSHKSGDGGQFGGCYSITPHMDDIKKPHLRQYLNDIMFS